MENTMELSQKIKNKTIVWSSGSTSGYLPEEDKNTNLKRFKHSHVHCGTIHNSQYLNTAQMSTDG